MPTVVLPGDLTFLCETEHVACFGGLDTGGRLQVHHVIENPLANLRELHDTAEEIVRVLKEDFGQYRVFTVARDSKNHRFNQLFGFQSALVTYEMSNGETWEIMVRYF